VKRMIALLLTLALVFCFFAACGDKKGEAKTPDGTGPQSTQTPPDTANVSDGDMNYYLTQLRSMKTYPSDTATLNMTYYTALTSLSYFGHYLDHAIMYYTFFESLMEWDCINSRIEGNLAESWEWIDETTLRVKLHPGITSIAGDPVTASDVLWSLNFNNDTGLLATYYSYLDMPACKVVDDLTVDLATKSAYPYLPLDLCSFYFAIGCEKTARDIAYDEATGTWDQDVLDWDPSYGTGPYKLIELDPTETFYKCERNENYWNETKPYYKYINVFSVLDASTRAFSLEAGNYQFVDQLSAAQAAPFIDNDDFRLWNLSTLGAVVIFRINTAYEPLRIKELRQALALAIDYETLCEVACGGLAEPAYNAMVTTTSEYYKLPEAEKNFVRYDPELAKEKLKEAGFADGITLEFKFANSQTRDSKTAESLQFMFKQVGVTLEVVPLEAITFFDQVKAGDFQVAMSGATAPNPTNNVYKIDPSKDYSLPGWTNNYWYADLDYLQELCNKVYFEVDDAKRADAWTEMQALTDEYIPQIILYQPQNIFVSSSDIVGFSLSVYGFQNMAWIYPREYITG